MKREPFRQNLYESPRLQKKVALLPEELAKLLLERFNQESFLDQAEAADIIADAGGDEYLRTNDNGNIAIDKSVLAEFRKLTEGVAVWMKSAQAWRMFDPTTDAEGQREQPL